MLSDNGHRLPLFIFSKSAPTSLGSAYQLCKQLLTFDKSKMNNLNRDSRPKLVKRGSSFSSNASSASDASATSSLSSQSSLSKNKGHHGRRPSLPQKASSGASSIVSIQSASSKKPLPITRTTSGQSIAKSLADGRRGSAASIKSAQRDSGTELFNVFAILATYGCGGHYRILPDPVPVFNQEGGIDVTYITGGGPGRHSAVTEWEVAMLRKFGLPKLSKPDNMPGAKLNKRVAEIFTTKFIVFMCDNGDTCIVPNPEALEEGDLE